MKASAFLNHRCRIASLGIASIIFASPAWAQSTANPERNAYFGQTHQHTSWSLDAYIIGNTLAGPEDAYKFAMGQPIKHPAANYMVKIGRPLDFEPLLAHQQASDRREAKGEIARRC